MNKYLLLRDNKQTGPYSLEELVAKGIKAYDLVWLDGKSAAWRYPSEIEELKSYSPVVEEQPYDRFYKKPTQQQEKTQDQSSVVEAREILKQEPVAEPLAVLHEVRIDSETNNTSPQRKIFVTMPANANNRFVKRPEPTPPKEEKPSSPVVSEKAPETEETKPVQRESKIEPIVTSYYPPTAEQTESFSQLLENKYSIQDEKVVNIRRKQPPAIDRKLVFRAVIALCLLLGGVVIGLVISNMNQKSDNQDLNDLVKQIRLRDQKLQEQSKASLPLTEPELTTSTDLQEEEKNNKPGISEKKDPAPANEDKKINNSTSSVEKNQDKPIVSNTASTDNDIKVTPAVIAPKKDEAVIEAARKNINQLVSVESNKYKTGVLGGISDLRLTISNNSLFQLDRVEVEIRYLGPEKRVVKTQTLLFNDVPAGKQVTLDAPKTSRGVSIDYSIRTINSKELGLAHSGF